MGRKRLSDLKLEASKYMVVVEREEGVAVYRERNTYRRYSIPTFEKEEGISPEQTILTRYKAKMGYEIINLIFKGVIKRTIDENGTTEKILLYKATECYGSPKSDERSAIEWIPRERLHRYQKGGDIAQAIANLTDERCSIFTYGFGDKEPVKSEICMIDAISEELIPEAVEVIRLAFRTVADTYAFSEETFPNFAAYMVTNEFLTKFYYRRPNQYIFAYIDNEKILGVIALYHNRTKNMAELSILAVHPEYRHSKIGESLLDYAVRFAKDLACDGAVLEMMVENTILKKWFLSKDFVLDRVFGTPNCPYKIGVMKKMLK